MPKNNESAYRTNDSNPVSTAAHETGKEYPFLNDDALAYIKEIKEDDERYYPSTILDAMSIIIRYTAENVVSDSEKQKCFDTLYSLTRFKDMFQSIAEKE